MCYRTALSYARANVPQKVAWASAATGTVRTEKPAPHVLLTAPVLSVYPAFFSHGRVLTARTRLFFYKAIEVAFILAL